MYQAGAGEPCSIPMKPSIGQNAPVTLLLCTFSGGSEEEVEDPERFQDGWLE